MTDNTMREAFEKWARTECFDLAAVGGFYSDNETDAAYKAMTGSSQNNGLQAEIRETYPTEKAGKGNVINSLRHSRGLTVNHWVAGSSPARGAICKASDVSKR